MLGQLQREFLSPKFILVVTSSRASPMPCWIARLISASAMSRFSVPTFRDFATRAPSVVEP
jgi:hypothetical protein